MDAGCFSGEWKRGILDAKDFAFASSEMKWSYSQKNLSFPGSKFWRVFSSSAKLSETVTGRFRPMRFLAIAASFVTFSHMLFLANPLKVICSIVGFVTVNVMNKMRMVWAFKPTSGDHPMVKRAPHVEIILSETHLGLERLELSKNFPTMRNSIEVAKESIFDSIYRCAHHVVPFRGYINCGKA